MALSRRDLLRASAGAVLLGAGLGRAEAQAALPLRELRDRVRGRVLAPGDAGYDAARLVFNRRFDAIRPPAVVRALDAADVRATVRWAGRHDVPLVVRAGGNAYNGASTSREAVVLDVGVLDGFALRDGVAAVGPGLRNLRLYSHLARHGVALPSGSCPNVAIGGLALGGGIGLAGRALGLTLDRVVAFDVVDADGGRRTVDAHHDPDLFWALRGGGGSFAVVTKVHLRVHALRRAAWFFASYPEASRDEALATWDDLAPGAPRELTAICTLTGTRASAFGQYLGSESALRRLVAPLAAIPGARFSAGTDSFLALQRRWAACADGASTAACVAVPRATFDASSVYVSQRLSSAARHAFLRAADGGAALVLDAYGGAIGAVAPDATAFAHRDARFSVQILSYAPIGTARPRVRHARALIAPFGDGGAYPNYPDLDLRSPRRAYYGANLPRLRAIKAAVDAADRFRPAQGIR
jgi:FAD/FMN-containing dehydrogenase